MFQRLAAEHPDTDDYVRAISRYHRLEEARHLAFARTTIGEHYRHTTWTDRLAVRWIVPIALRAMFDTVVQPFVYPTVGLPALRTWLRFRRQRQRVGLRQQCARAVLTALIDADIFTPPHIPLFWRRVAGVDRDGTARHSQPRSDVPPATPTPSALANLWNATPSIWHPIREVSHKTWTAANAALTSARQRAAGPRLAQSHP